MVKVAKSCCQSCSLPGYLLQKGQHQKVWELFFAYMTNSVMTAGEGVIDVRVGLTHRFKIEAKTAI